ncbi:hypothetical protein WT24_02140 [Burkholderia sp. MSMB1078WGS]|nr:hypothetical protein WS61_12400 [Burkholderia sp. ABCPW 11]KVT06064.1 hypothetical protein WT24_02140 [Burkholderia sp. MSMB1078WGS]
MESGVAHDAKPVERQRQRVDWLPIGMAPHVAVDPAFGARQVGRCPVLPGRAISRYASSASNANVASQCSPM